MREYMASKKGEPASISEIKAAIEPKVGIAPASSCRSALPNERYFGRVSRGVFRLRAGASMIGSERSLARLALTLGAAEAGGLLSPGERALARSAAALPPVPGCEAAEVRAGIGDGQDPLGEAFCTLRDPALRRADGAVYTPGQLVSPMVDWVSRVERRRQQARNGLPEGIDDARPLLRAKVTRHRRRLQRHEAVDELRDRDRLVLRDRLVGLADALEPRALGRDHGVVDGRALQQAALVLPLAEILRLALVLPGHPLEQLGSEVGGHILGRTGRVGKVASKIRCK
jgi:hypothetical protein